jgi:serine/threonine protein kinase
MGNRAFRDIMPAARMPLTTGTKLGPYEILAPAGAGGMGEVYRARDTRLDREVAVKVLSAQLSSSADLRARFEREARAISSLQHPHICTLFDVGHQNGTDFLVMEFLEGETLAERLKRGPLPLEQLLKTGIEVAEALEKAHRQGILHRDLKPGNVMLTKSGAKLMDFGLAKSFAAVGAAASGSSLPTFTAAPTISSPASPLTAEGTVVGTFQYMSPEQVEGREADARSDIFAFGAVLYEMATGKRAFEGKSQLSVASAVLEKDPEPMSALAPMTPPALEHLVKTCLAKEPDERWQSAADIARQLRWIADAGSQVGAPRVVSSRRRLQQRAFFVLAPALIILAVFAGYFFPRPQPSTLPAIRAMLPPPPDVAYPGHPSFALSPDSSKLAFIGRKSGGRFALYVRQMATGTVQELAGTTDAWYPFWSPDSRHIGFFAAGKLHKVDTVGGAVTAVADARNGRGGAWSSRGVIVFAPENNGPLMQVPESGGAATPLTTMAEAEQSHRWPIFLPDGETVLFFLAATATSGLPSADPLTISGIYTVRLSGGGHRKLFTADSNAAYDPAGYLLYVHQANLMAHPFDAAKLQFRGLAVPVAQHVRYHPARWVAAFSISPEASWSPTRRRAAAWALPNSSSTNWPPESPWAA